MHHLAQLKMYMGPYKGFLKTRLDQAGDIQLAATALHREITGQGYGGRITIVQRFLKRIWPKPESESIVRSRQAAGHQLQSILSHFVTGHRRCARLPLNSGTRASRQRTRRHARRVLWNIRSTNSVARRRTYSATIPSQS